MAQAAQEVRGSEGVTLPEAGTYALETSHTSVEFVARHMLSKVRGRFAEFEGTVVVGDPVEASSVAVEIKAGTISTGDERRDGHLKGDDFLTVDRYPALSFKSTAVRSTGGANFELDGDLTIKDITKPVTLKGEYLGFGPGMQGEQRLFASASTTIDREDWDLTWNVAVETGGLLVGKKVEIVLDVEAVKQS